MRTGGSDFKDALATSDDGAWADSETHIIDWLNLPKMTQAVSLWDCLHDAEIVSLRSNLLERTMSLDVKSTTCANFTNLMKVSNSISTLAVRNLPEFSVTQYGRAGVQFQTDFRLKSKER